MINNVFEESLVNALTKGLHPIPKGTEIPLDVPLVVVEGKSPAAVVTIWRNGYKDFVGIGNHRTHFTALGDPEVQEYSATKFWEPDPMDEDDKSDRVLVNAAGTKSLRVIWNDYTRRWTVLQAQQMFFTLAELTQHLNWIALKLEFDREDHRHASVTEDGDGLS